MNPPSNSSEPALAVPHRLSPLRSQPRPGTPASLQEHRHHSRFARPRPISPSPSLPIISPESLHLKVPPRTPSPHPDGASIVSRRSSRPSSLRLDTTASALFGSPEARAVRANVYEEIVGGWSMLTTSSKALVLYYLLATTVEVQSQAFRRFRLCLISQLVFFGQL